MTQEQIDLLKKVNEHPSKYPYIYKLLKTINKQKIFCKTPAHELVINTLIKPTNNINDLEEKNKIFLQYSYSFLEDQGFLLYKRDYHKNVYNIPEIDLFLLDLFKLFFVYDANTHDFIKNNRIPYYNERNNWEEKSETEIFDSIRWRYDGWFNNVLNDGKDLQRDLDFLQQVKNTDNLNKHNILLAYRLYDKDEVKQALKKIKEYKFFKFRELRKTFLSLSPHINFITRIILTLLNYDEKYFRFFTNRYLFLYRITHKKSYLKKLLKINNYFKIKRKIQLSKLLLMEDNTNLDMRPQHFLKVIEVELEKDKPDEEYVKMLFLSCIKTMNYYYINEKDIFLNYFCIFELLFVIFLYFNTKNIDILNELEEN